MLRPSLELKSKIGTPIRRSTAIHLFLFSWSSAKQEMSSYSLSPLRVAMMNMSVRPRWSPTASSSTGTATTVPLDAPDDSREARDRSAARASEVPVHGARAAEPKSRYEYQKSNLAKVLDTPEK